MKKVYFSFYTGYGEEHFKSKFDYHTSSIPPRPGIGEKVVVDGIVYVIKDVVSYFESPHEITFIIEEKIDNPEPKPDGHLPEVKTDKRPKRSGPKGNKVPKKKSEIAESGNREGEEGNREGNGGGDGSCGSPVEAEILPESSSSSFDGHEELRLG